MSLLFVGVDPDTPNSGSPTIWVDEDDGSIVIQGLRITDEQTLGEILATGPIPDHGLALPGNDFWVFDSEVTIINHFAGDGSWVGEERCDDPVTAKLCALAFEQVWKRATPHEQYGATCL